MTVAAVVDVGALGLDGGAHILVKLALRDAPPGEVVGCAAPTPTCSASSRRGAASRAIACGSAAVRRRIGRRAVAYVERGPSAALAARRRHPGRRGPGDDASSTGRPPTGASRRAARWSRPADRRRRSRCDRPRRDLDRPGPTALRPGARRPVGPERGDRLERADRQHGAGRGRRRAGDDVPHRERGGGARRAGPVPRPGPSRTSARSSRCSPSPSPTRPVTSRCSPGGPTLGGAELAPVDRRRPGVAADAARRARLRHRLVPALGDGGGHVRVAARVPRAPRPRRR